MTQGQNKEVKTGKSRTFFEKSKETLYGFQKTPHQRRLNLTLDERSYHAKFGCICMHGVQMHHEQTDKLSSLYIHRGEYMHRRRSH